MATHDEGWRNVHDRLDALLAWASPEYAAAGSYMETVKATPAAGAALAAKLARPSIAASIAAVAKGVAEKPSAGFGAVDAELAMVESYAAAKGFKPPIKRIAEVVEPGGFFGAATKAEEFLAPDPKKPNPMDKAARVVLAVAIAAGVSLLVMAGWKLGAIVNAAKGASP